MSGNLQSFHLIYRRRAVAGGIRFEYISPTGRRFSLLSPRHEYRGRYTSGQQKRGTGCVTQRSPPLPFPLAPCLREFLRDSRFLPFVFIYFSRRRKFIPRRVARLASFYLAANIEIYLCQIHDERSLVDTNCSKRTLCDCMYMCVCV